MNIGIFNRRRDRGIGQLPPAMGSALPPGVRQSDCDGPAQPLADHSAAQLWNTCNFAQQESLCQQFAAQTVDLLRDALLDERATPPAGAAWLGDLLLCAWIRFRDRRVREMLHHGELATCQAQNARG